MSLFITKHTYVPNDLYVYKKSTYTTPLDLFRRKLTVTRTVVDLHQRCRLRSFPLNPEGPLYLLNSRPRPFKFYSELVGHYGTSFPHNLLCFFYSRTVCLCPCSKTLTGYQIDHCFISCYHNLMLGTLLSTKMVSMNIFIH